MSRYSGPYYKGTAKKIREEKKLEAEERNAETPVERRRWARLGLLGPKADAA